MTAYARTGKLVTPATRGGTAWNRNPLRGRSASLVRFSTTGIPAASTTVILVVIALLRGFR